jgi:hypothetical protein
MCRFPTLRTSAISYAAWQHPRLAAAFLTAMATVQTKQDLIGRLCLSSASPTCTPAVGWEDRGLQICGQLRGEEGVA